MMFAALVLEREPARWIDLPYVAQLWIQNAGAVAILGLVLGGLASLLREGGFRKGWNLQAKAMVTLTLAALLLYGAGILSQTRLFVTIGGSAALVAALMHIVPAVFTRFRWGRIWAIARLSIKEAIRSRVILIFSVMAGVFLFADWFVPYRPEDQVRNYVRVIYWSMTPLFLMTASLLGAFNIPNEVRNQSIHTIVTKPVQRFEIVLGRFIGYGVVLTVGLAILSGASLLYLTRGVHPDAVRESYTARVPLFGDYLSFWGTKDPSRGENVGRIWDYRSYIAGRSGDQAHYAIWTFNTLPGWLATSSEPAKFELTFDIFRLRKGEKEREGLYCTFSFVDGQLSIPEAEAVLARLTEGERQQKDAVYRAKEDKLKNGEDADAVAKWSDAELAKIDAALLEKHKAYVIGAYKVVDYETQELAVPAGLFAALAKEERADDHPMLNVLVSVERSPAEREAMGMLGVAKYDFYLLAAERPFWMNFLKGLAGMWCSVMLILGLAVACSTYFNGVISWLCAIFIFSLGVFPDYLRMIAAGAAPGGGPLEAGHRLITRAPEAVPLDDSPGITVIRGVDTVYRWVLNQFLTIIPDINRYDLHNYVANGFDISWGQVLLLDNLLYLIAYLLPWAVLAYYLIESREIANPS